MRKLLFLVLTAAALFGLSNSDVIADYWMDECYWGAVTDHSGNGYDATPVNEANTTSGGVIFRDGNLTVNNYLKLNTAINLPLNYTVKLWIKWPLDSTGHTNYGGWRRLYYFDILDGSDSSSMIYFEKYGNRWYWCVDGTRRRFTAPSDGWHMFTFVVEGDIDETHFYIDKGKIGDISKSVKDDIDVIGTNNNNKEGRTIGAFVDEFIIFNRPLSSSEIEEVYDNESTGKNFDSSTRNSTLCPVSVSCNLKNGIKLSTYDITDYSQHYPYDHSDYDDLENNFAVDSKKFGSGILDNINTTGSDNNPFSADPDSKYLSIFEGYIYIPSAGTYTFAVNGDDAVEIMFNDEEYYGWYGGHGSDGTDHNKEFEFGEAGYYKIKFRHEEWLGADNYQLYWKNPGESSFSIVPKENLFYCAPPNALIDYRMDGCEWDGDTSTYEINNYGTASDANATALNGANTEDNETLGGMICRAGDFRGKYIEVKSGNNIGNTWSMSTWIKFPLEGDNNVEINGYRYYIIATVKGTGDLGYFAKKSDGSNDYKWGVYDNNGYISEISLGAISDGWHHVVEVVKNNRTYLYIDKELKGSVNRYTSGELKYIGTSTDSSDDETIGAYMDEFKIFDTALSETNIDDIYEYESERRNYDGSERECVICPVTPECSLQNGLKFSTYDISDYSQHYPQNHADYDTLENNFAVNSEKYGSKIINVINTTGSNNNPFHTDPDDKYLSIFDGYIYIPSAGEYYFAVNGDDAVEVMFNGRYYYGWYGGHGSDGTDHNKKFVFGKAGYYKLKFRHEEWTGGDSYQLYWKRPGDSDYSIVPQTYLFVCSPPKPVADYRMDKCDWSGVTGEVADYSGNDINGTAKNGATTDNNAKLCKSGRFAADSQQYIEIPKNSYLTIGNALTYMAWIRIYDPNYSGNSDHLENIFTNQTWKNALRYTEKGYGVNENKILFQLSIDGDVKYLYSNTKIEDTDWHHIAGVYDGNSMKIYIDGELDSELNVSGSIDTGNADDLIASEYGGYYFNGNIDELKIFNTGLSGDEVSDIYTNEKNLLNYDGTLRSCMLCPVTPECSLQNGLLLSTYDISAYSQRYPYNHTDYDNLETNFAVNDKKFGSGKVDTINTTGSNNNPFHTDPDDKYLSIFDGYIYIPSAGEYYFAVNGDDAVEVMFNDEEYYGWYGGHGSDGTDHNKKFVFGKAGYYKLKFRHEEWTGGDSYQLYWKKPGESDYSIVPENSLFYCVLSSTFNVWDVFRNIDDQNISTKIVNKEFNLTIASLDENGSALNEFNGTVCVRIVDDNDVNYTNWEKFYFEGTDETNWTDIIVNRALKKAKVQIVWKQDVNESCPLSNEDNSTYSTDKFAIRPERFYIDTNETPLIAGKEFKLRFYAKDHNDNNSSGFDETYDVEYNVSCNKENFSPDITSVQFNDGFAEEQTKYPDTAEVNMTIKEKDDCEYKFAAIDCGDQNVSGYWNSEEDIAIEPYTAQLFFNADHFDINASLLDYDNNFTYYDNELNVYSVLDINITAKGYDNATLINYNTQCYANDIDINISKIFRNLDSRINNMVYFYKDAANVESSHDIINAGEPLTIRYDETNFTSETNGTTRIKIYMNFDRNISEPLNPVEMNVSEINVSDGQISGTLKNIGKVTYYYGNLILNDVMAQKNELNASGSFVIYDENSTDTLIPAGAKELVYNWYENLKHRLKDGNVTDVVVSADYNSSNVITGVQADVLDINNGKIDFNITRTDSGVNFAVIHILNSDLSWLWYSKFGDEYNDSNGSTCLHHFCFTVTWSGSGEAGEVGSGEFNGTEANITETNTTKRGVKIFR